MLARRTSRFRHNQEGAVLILGILFFMVFLLVAGLAIDFARFESERTRMQSTADRAALAATLMTESTLDIDPASLAQAYFDAEGLGATVDGRIEVFQSDEEGRTVRITPSSILNTLFMRWSGISSLKLNALATATHGRGFVPGGAEATHMELVLVLDVSGSMKSKIENLKIAASALSEKVLGPASPGTVGLSIFTYADYVIPPVGMVSGFPNVSGSGQCMEFTVWNEFLGSYDQPMLRHQCKTSEDRRAQLYVSSAAEAVAFINQMETRKGTSIDQGVRFGAMMFDPSIQPIISHLISLGHIDPVFEGRPLGVTPGVPLQKA